MNDHAILTAIGTDRPGLVEDVSRFILEHGGNILDSRMVNLRGQFAMMLLISAACEPLRQMQSALPHLIGRTSLHVEMHPAAKAPPATRPGRPYRLTASSLDRAGLVHQIAQLLRSMSINIESMDTSLAAAPHTGSPIFEMDLSMTIPAEVSLGQLRQKLGSLCDELNVDWQLSSL